MIHPLDPLSKIEIESAVKLLKTTKKLGESDRFISVMLHEPTKSSLLAYEQDRTPVAREAAIIILNNDQEACYEAIVSLTVNKVISWHHVQDVQPSFTLDEQIECEHIVKSSALFIDSLAKLRIDDVELIMVDLWSPGNFGFEEEQRLRLARPLCFLRSDSSDNGYARPLGLIPVVDLNKKKVLRVEEYNYRTIPTNSANYNLDRVGKLRSEPKPILISQPEGPSFTVDGYKVSWQKWQFRIGFNCREGLTLHQISYEDQNRTRPILYRAALSEMVVPYGDPGPTQNRKNAFDSGEYGIGQLANSLELGCDCVGHIQYFDATMTNSTGEIVIIKNAICLHEEDYGILWKHTDWRTNEVEVRRSRRLVISSISTVANYEYGFFWYLYQDGNIEFQVKLTGILSVGVLEEGELPLFGTMITPDLYAPNHQHFFNVRLDLQIDGNNNSVYEVDTITSPVGPDNPMSNAFMAKYTLLKTEQEAIRDLNFNTARYWKFVNDSIKNEMGQSVGYKIVPGENCFPFAAADAKILKRASFIKHHLWVTPYDNEEMYAGGKYPNQHPGGDGLGKWTEQNRNIVDRDIVVWYTMGHNHIPRPEDWPVMPVAYTGFLLKPVSFFDKSPAIDVPPSRKKTHCGSKEAHK
jgi:primary-amine oxidase